MVDSKGNSAIDSRLLLLYQQRDFLAFRSDGSPYPAVRPIQKAASHRLLSAWYKRQVHSAEVVVVQVLAVPDEAAGGPQGRNV